MGETATRTKHAADEVASEAKDEGKHVAEVAKQDATAIAGEARDEARHVMEEAKAQAATAVDEAKTKLLHEADSQAGRMADSVHRLTDELDALAQGRPEDAGTTREYIEKVSEKLGDFADHVEQRGFSGIVEDVEVFARRRPGMFLAGAAAAGFLAGRMLRSTKDSSDGSQGDGRAQAVPGVPRGASTTVAPPAGTIAPATATAPIPAPEPDDADLRRGGAYG